SIVSTSVINLPGLCAEDFSSLGNLVEPCGKTLDSRFHTSLTELIEAIDGLCASEPKGSVLHSVLAKLKSEPTKRWLRNAFFSCHLFAQTVKQFLFSPKLRDYFDSFKDSWADRDEEQATPIYKLGTLEFPVAPVQNPIAFLR